MPRLARLAFCFVTCLLISTSFAQQPTTSSVPNLIRYSGTLEATQAMTVSSAPVGVTFAIYNQQDGGAPIWQETQNVTLDSNGQYNVILGSTTATGLPDDLFSRQEQRWLGVQVQGHAEEARVLLVSVPYALKAHEAETLGGLPVSAFVKAAAADSGTGTETTAGAAPGQSAYPAQAPANDQVLRGQGAASYVPLWTSPYQLHTSVIYQATGGNIGIGTVKPFAKFDVNDNSATSVISGTTTNSSEFGAYGNNMATSGNAVGTAGHTLSPTGTGVSGFHDSKIGLGSGVTGLTNSSSGMGVSGIANTPSGPATGVSGASASVDGVGVAGLVTSTGAPEAIRPLA